MLAGRRERLAGAGQLLLRQGVINGELPASLDVDAVTRGILALLDGLMLQRIEAGDAYRPADLERRATAIVDLLLGHGRPGARPDGVASRAMAHVQTVLGPIDPDALGFTLPHEHTQIALWHIESRWDYWQLTRDQPVIVEELARFRAAGGSGLVDLTLPGVGRDPLWLRDVATATGLHVVMGCGWYRTAYYPAEARIDRRSVDDLADELVAEIEIGVGDTGVRPGIIGEIGTDKPWVSPAEERVHRAAARAARRTGLAITTHGVLSDVGLAQLRIFEEEGVDPGAGRHRSRRFVPVPRPLPGDHRARREPRVRLHRHALGARAARRGTHGRAGLRAARAWSRRPAVPQPGRLQRLAADARSAATATRTWPRPFLPRLRTAGVSDAEIETMTVANPRRLLTIG